MDNSSSNVVSKEHDDSETHMEHQISQHMEHSNQPKEEHLNQVPLSLLSKSGEHSNQDVEPQCSLDEHSSIKNEEQISDLQTMESQGEQHSKHDVGHPSTSQKDLESNAQHVEVSNQPPEIVTQSRATITEIEEQISDTQNMESQSSLDNTQISQKSGEEEINDSPIEQVRLTVPNKDDPTLPCLTFCIWILGITTGAAVSFINQYFGFRQNKVHILPVSAQIPVLLIGKLMAAYLPQKSIRIPRTKWLFSLNPGPFNIKEHTQITIFANVGSRDIQATTIITILKAFYNQELHPLTEILLTLST